MKETCETCANHQPGASLDDAPGICWDCASNAISSGEVRPYWKPMSKAYDAAFRPDEAAPTVASDGSTASYYQLPAGAKELQDLISHRDMNAQIGEIFRATYRYGQASHSPKIRDIKKIIYYAQEELKRLENVARNSAS